MPFFYLNYLGFKISAFNLLTFLGLIQLSLFPMRIALGIEYDGSGFCGWQMQNHGTRTVQGCLQQALSSIADEPKQVTCAGRTDTGVHAVNQVVHFDVAKPRPMKAWVMGMNTQLPDDLCVTWAVETSDDFDARFSAFERRYRYVISNRQARPALLKHRVHWWYGDLNVDIMHRAAQALIGEQDFSSFRSSQCQASHARRNVTAVSVRRDGDFIYVDITANAFLHHMVRNIVGSLLEIGKGFQPEHWIADLLLAKDRTQAGPTAAADGLYLVNVRYPDQFAIPEVTTAPSFT